MINMWMGLPSEAAKMAGFCGLAPNAPPFSGNPLPPPPYLPGGILGNFPQLRYPDLT